MDFKGKKAVFLGDSITEGHGTSGAEHIYVSLMKQRLGLSDVVNYGIGGTRIAKQQIPSAVARHDLDFVSRADEMDEDADLVVVFGGTNDFGHGDAPFGKLSDRTADTFCGACHVLFEKLMNKYPQAQIVVMTPLHRSNEDNPRGDGNKPEDVATLSEYVDCIKVIARGFSIPVLDLFAVSGIQPKLEIMREHFCPDGLHPNDAGHIRIADRLEGFLKTL